MPVVAWSRSLTPERAKADGIGFCATPLDVAKTADAVSLHLAAAPETKNLVGEKFLSAMKDGAILINTARGEVVDQVALEKPLMKKNSKWAWMFMPENPRLETKPSPTPLWLPKSPEPIMWAPLPIKRPMPLPMKPSVW